MVGAGEGWWGAVGALALVLVLSAGACGSPVPDARRATTTTPSAIAGEPGPALPTLAPVPAPSTTVPPAATRPAAVPSTTPAPGTAVEVAYRLERRTTDPATAGFEATAQSTLADPRGWSRAGFRLVSKATAPFLVVLAEGPEVDRLCLPYETYGLYSCQNGPVVALNADRWRTATPKWTGTLDDYRRYLVAHEVGHLLGLRHPDPQCPAAGQPAPLMAQQSTELNGCLPNPWPLEAEVEQGRRRPPDLAPPYRR
jgi:hypothetical protein